MLGFPKTSNLPSTLNHIVFNTIKLDLEIPMPMWQTIYICIWKFNTTVG